MSKTKQLEALYRANWQTFEERIPVGEGFSMPLLADVGEDFDDLTFPLVVVGQQTMDWLKPWDQRGSGDHVSALRECYRNYLNSDTNPRKSVFHQAALHLQHLLNPRSRGRSYCWLNIFVSSQNRDRPKTEHHDRLRRLSLLRQELAVLAPQVVVFLTGPIYDFSIKALLAGPADQPVFHEMPGYDRQHLVRISCPYLPPAAYRIDHPRTLRLRKRWHLLEILAEDAKKRGNPAELSS